MAEVRSPLYMYSVYFAKSLKNGKVYVGSTEKEANKRVEEHNQSSNQWSRLNKPLKLIYYEQYICKEDAVKRENFYKSGFGKQIKNAIIEATKDIWDRSSVG